MFLTALAEECLLRVCQVQDLLRQSPELSQSFVVEALFAAIDQQDKVGLLDIPFIIRNKNDARKVFRECSAYIFFNPRAATASYTLDIQRLCDRTVAEQLLILNRWHKLQALKNHLPDLS